MSRREIKTCDICGREDDDSKYHWEFKTVECKVKIPEDGVNGGDFSGDWCYSCRKRIGKVIRAFRKRPVPGKE